MPLLWLGLAAGLYATRKGAGGEKAEVLLVLLLLLFVPRLVVGCLIDSCSVALTGHKIIFVENEPTPAVVEDTQPAQDVADQMRLPVKQEVKRVSRQEVDEAWRETMMQINDRLRREEARAEVRRAEAAQLWLEQKQQLNDALRKEEERAAARRLEAEKLWKEQMKVYNPPSKIVVSKKASGVRR